MDVGAGHDGRHGDSEVGDVEMRFVAFLEADITLAVLLAPPGAGSIQFGNGLAWLHPELSLETPELLCRATLAFAWTSPFPLGGNRDLMFLVTGLLPYGDGRRIASDMADNPPLMVLGSHVVQGPGDQRRRGEHGHASRKGSGARNLPETDDLPEVRIGHEPLAKVIRCGNPKEAAGQEGPQEGFDLEGRAADGRARVLMKGEVSRSSQECQVGSPFLVSTLQSKLEDRNSPAEGFALPQECLIYFSSARQLLFDLVW